MCAFRYFDAGTPTLVTTDLEIAKQVLIKDFNKFHSREVTAQTKTSMTITCYFDVCEGNISINNRNICLDLWGISLSFQDLIPKNPFSKHQNIFFSEGTTWKRLRSISSPTFSAGKMKEVKNYHVIWQGLWLILTCIFFCNTQIHFSDVTISKQLHR